MLDRSTAQSVASVSIMVSLTPPPRAIWRWLAGFTTVGMLWLAVLAVPPQQRRRDSLSRAFHGDAGPGRWKLPGSGMQLLDF